MDSKIVYKKTSDYDNDSFTSDNSQINLDDSVISIDVKNNYDSDFEHRNNIELKNVINKELTNQIINTPNVNNDNNDNNIKETSNENFENFEKEYLIKFINFIKNNNFNKEDIKNTNSFKQIIKLFIAQNNLTEKEINIFINIIFKYESVIFNEIFVLTEPVEHPIENFKNIADDIALSENSILNNNNSTFFNRLVDNDINTWIFIGIILISFIILIMIFINKK